MRLVPLIKPYISGLVDKLIGMDYTLGAASSHLDCVADRPPRYHSLMLSECHDINKSSLSHSWDPTNPHCHRILIKFLSYNSAFRSRPCCPAMCTGDPSARAPVLPRPPPARAPDLLTDHPVQAAPQARQAQCWRSQVRAGDLKA